MEKQSGYAVMTATISGYELLWRVIRENGEELPEVYEDEKAAQIAIIEDLEEDIQQFRDNERQWDEIHWPDQYQVVHITIDEEGMIRLYDDSNCLLADGELIREISLEEWRKSY